MKIRKKSKGYVEATALQPSYRMPNEMRSLVAGHCPKIVVNNLAASYGASSEMRSRAQCAYSTWGIDPES